MSSRSPSPKSSPNAPPPSSPPPSESNPDQTTDTPPPPVSNPDQTTDTPPPSFAPPPPPSPSAPPPQSSPPPVPSAPPPSPPQAPPPETSPPPPPPRSSPPPSPPPSSPPSPPNPPPPTTTNSPPPPNLPPPPEESPPPPVAPPPPPPAVSPSPPPPVTDPQPPTTTPPPPPVARPPKHSHPPPPLPPPPTSSQPIPPTRSPPPASTSSPPPLPPSSLPPSVSPPPLNNTTINGSIPISPVPSNPAEKPTARSTQSSPNITADAASRTSGGLSSGGVAALGSVMGFLALTLVVLGVWFAHRRKKRKDKFTLNYAMPSPFASSQNSDSSFLRSQFSSHLTGSASANNYMYSPDGGLGASRSWFTYQELSTATSGFSQKNLLGEGGFGCVYKGVIGEGREVAVKQLKAGGGQGEREFRAEVEIISRIHHRHLVSLVGYCISEQQRLLVYDYVPNETLHYHLHGEGKLDWANRVKVAAGAARGLAYLHEDCQPRIIHRDIKSTNILLDNNFEAKVADFGLAKLALELDLNTHVSTRVMGTFGYLAPEYASSGKLTEKSDVYSFGVVLLELITGRKPVDASQPLGDESLVEWARPLLTQALETEDFGEDLVDRRLENNFIPSEMFRMIEAAAACVRHLASKRPKMSQVVRALDSMDELADLNNGMKPGQSGIFSSREHSAQIKMFQRMAFGSQDYSSEYFNNSQNSWRS